MFSSAEKKLFRTIPSFDDDYIEHMSKHDPIGLYKIAALKAFTLDLKGDNINALRKGLTHLDGNGQRGDKYFDDLISF